MQKSAYELGYEAALMKLSAGAAEEAIAKVMGFLPKAFKSKKPQYVTREQLEESAKRINEQLKMVGPSKTEAPKVYQKSNKPKSPKSIWADFHKQAQNAQLDPRYYEDEPAKKRIWPWALGGAALGGLGAYHFLPNEMTTSYRDIAKGLEDKARASEQALSKYYDPSMERYTPKTKTLHGAIPRSEVAPHLIRVKDINAKGAPVDKLLAAHQAQKYFKNRAYAEAMPRSLLGAGAGLALGILGGSMF